MTANPSKPTAKSGTSARIDSTYWNKHHASIYRKRRLTEESLLRLRAFGTWYVEAGKVIDVIYTNAPPKGAGRAARRMGLPDEAGQRLMSAG